MKRATVVQLGFLVLVTSIAAGPRAPIEAVYPWGVLELPDDSSHDDFGGSVSIHRNLVLVGARGDDDAGPEAGSAHLFSLGRGGWRRVQELEPQDATGLPAFGTSVALSRRVLAVGAPGYLTGTSAGFVEIYRRQGARWRREAVLRGSDTERGSHFGITVALDGEILVVGAPGTTVSPGVVGAVYVFQHEGGEWREVQKLVGRPWDTGAGFGSSIALDPRHLVVGAPRESHVRDGGDTGTVYVYDRMGSIFERAAELRGGDERSQTFGFSVALSRGRIAVGAPAVGAGISGGSSAAFLFVREEDGSWSPEARLRPETVRNADRFGRSVAMRGNRLYVGAPSTRIPGDTPHTILGTGLVYAYSRVGGSWIEGEILRPPGFADFVADSMALDWPLLVVGAPHPAPTEAAVYARLGPR